MLNLKKGARTIGAVGRNDYSKQEESEGLVNVKEEKEEQEREKRESKRGKGKPQEDVENLVEDGAVN